MNDVEAKRAEQDITDEIRSGLANVRTERHLDLKWKPLVKCFIPFIVDS